MPTLHIVPDDLRELYRVHEWRNAAGVLATACPVLVFAITERLYVED